MKIRAKVLLLFLPLIAVSVSVSGIISTFAARNGMTRIAIQLLGFKSDELLKFGKKQWELLVQNEVTGDRIFRDAAEQAIHSYAETIATSDSELIFALDAGRQVAFSTGDLVLAPRESESLITGLDGIKRGWFDAEIAGSDRVGFTFYFEPFAWFVFVTDEATNFYKEVNQILITNFVTIVVLSAIAVVLSFVFSLYLTRPINAVMKAIGQMAESQNFFVEVPVMYDDEIGNLAFQFNSITNELATTYHQLQKFAIEERKARNTVNHRENETLRVLGSAAEYRDPDTGEHIIRVGLFCRMLAIALGDKQVDPEIIYHAAPLHDIGKLGIPDSILLKPGSLDSAEMTIMKTHAEIGAEILDKTESPYLQAGKVIAQTHHERFDGTGYPKGLAGDRIPMYGRIVGLVDVFDAVTSNRPYKKAWTLESAAEMILEEKGRHFDPELVDLFMERMDEIAAIKSRYSEE